MAVLIHKKLSSRRKDLLVVVETRLDDAGAAEERVAAVLLGLVDEGGALRQRRLGHWNALA